jgi:hypothetical protein
VATLLIQGVGLSPNQSIQELNLNKLLDIIQEYLCLQLLPYHLLTAAPTTCAANRPAFVQPKVLPGGVRHQVSCPGVRNLVGNDVGGASVPRQKSRCDERKARILHAAIWEARRQHQEVVLAPAVGPRERLAGCKKVCYAGKLLGGGVYDLRLSPDA